MEGCLWSHYTIYPCRALIIVMEQAINRIKEDFECLSFFKKLWSDLVGEYTHVYFIARLIFQHPSRQISSQHIVSQVPNILYKSKLGSIGWNLMQDRKLFVYNINKRIEKLKNNNIPERISHKYCSAIIAPKFTGTLSVNLLKLKSLKLVQFTETM